MVSPDRLNIDLRAGKSKARFGLPSDIFGAYEWQIHQRAARDADFRALCEEHEEAMQALEHFRSLDESPARMEEYTALVEELQQDILLELKRP